jgi:large subunit ribosomal protein L7/L12
MKNNEHGHLILESGRVITSHKVINLVEAFDKLKLEDFQPLIPDLRERWNVAEDQEIVQGPAIETTTTPVLKQTEFDAVLTAVGTDRISTIKLVREITGASLGDSKAAIDKLPFTLKSSISEQEVQGIVEKFKAIGATVEAK